MIIAWTGHRPQGLSNCDGARQLVIDKTKELLEHYKYDELSYITGGAQGVDYWAACCAVAEYIPCTIYLPFPLKIMTKMWDDSDREDLRDLLIFANCKIISKAYSKQGYQIRNIKMVDDADQLIAVWNGKECGGTWNTIKYARSKNVPVTILAET